MENPLLEDGTPTLALLNRTGVGGPTLRLPAAHGWAQPARPTRAAAGYVDERDIVWVSDWGADVILSFDPRTEQFTPYPMSEKGADVRQILGRSGEVWLPESATSRLMVIRTGASR